MNVKTIVNSAGKIDVEYADWKKRMKEKYYDIEIINVETDIASYEQYGDRYTDVTLVIVYKIIDFND